MSWREFRFNLRPISLLAVGCVAFTTVAAAAAAHWLLGFSWPVGFVLGAIVSPPDAVAPLSIARRLQIPKRILVILEGEGLANDATALILYRFAIVAVSAGAFSFGHAAGEFAAILAGEAAMGNRGRLGDAASASLGRRSTDRDRAFDPDAICGLLASGASGRLRSAGHCRCRPLRQLERIEHDQRGDKASGNLLLGRPGVPDRRHCVPHDRATGAGIGHGPRASFPAQSVQAAAALVCLVVIVARFVWVFPATYLPRWLSPALARRDPAPPWQWPFMLGFTGVRGIVSLAAALAIPFTMADGRPFPERDQILFLTFSVILVTLVGQGLMLPAVIRVLGLAPRGRARAADRQDGGAASAPTWHPGRAGAARRTWRRNSGYLGMLCPAFARSSGTDFVISSRPREHDERSSGPERRVRTRFSCC